MLYESKDYKQVRLAESNLNRAIKETVKEIKKYWEDEDFSNPNLLNVFSRHYNLTNSARYLYQLAYLEGKAEYIRCM